MKSPPQSPKRARSAQHVKQLIEMSAEEANRQSWSNYVECCAKGNPKVMCKERKDSSPRKIRGNAHKKREIHRTTVTFISKWENNFCHLYF